MKAWAHVRSFIISLKKLTIGKNKLISKNYYKELNNSKISYLTICILADIGALTKNGNSSNGKNKQIAESPVENGNMNPHYEDELGNSHSVPTSPRSREQLRLHILNDHLEPSFKVS